MKYNKKVLQQVTSIITCYRYEKVSKEGITKCDNYYKMRCNKCYVDIFSCFLVSYIKFLLFYQASVSFEIIISRIVKWGYQANFKPVYFFFFTKRFHAHKSTYKQNSANKTNIS